MAYFFGFFGISFLDTNAMARSPSTFGLSQLDHQLYVGGHPAESEFAGRGVDVAGTMCAKEAPQPAGARVEKPVPPPLAPIPEGDEFSNMSNEEVKIVVVEQDTSA